MPDHAVIVSDSGFTIVYQHDCFENRSNEFVWGSFFAHLGTGLPQVIGAQLANPGKLVIDVDGDGSIRMNLGELETLTTYDIPVKVLLLNNQGDGMVRQWQDLFYTSRYSGTDKTLHTKDFIKAVEADGFKFARRVTEKADTVSMWELLCWLA